MRHPGLHRAPLYIPRESGTPDQVRGDNETRVLTLGSHSVFQDAKTLIRRRLALMLGLAHRLEHARGEEADRVDDHRLLLYLALALFIVALHAPGHRGGCGFQPGVEILPLPSHLLTGAVACGKRWEEQCDKAR